MEDRRIAESALTPAQWALIGSLGLGVLFFFVLKKLLRTYEPPIRVRKGSMILELDLDEWIDTPSDPPNSWSPGTGGVRGGQSLKVEVTGVAGCSTMKGKKVELTYSDGTKVTIQATGVRTKVRPKDKLSPSADMKRLTYQRADGFIKELKVTAGGPPSSCTFEEGDDPRITISQLP